MKKTKSTSIFGNPSSTQVLIVANSPQLKIRQSSTATRSTSRNGSRKRTPLALRPPLAGIQESFVYTTVPFHGKSPRTPIFQRGDHETHALLAPRLFKISATVSHLLPKWLVIPSKIGIQDNVDRYSISQKPSDLLPNYQFSVKNFSASRS